MSTQQQPKTKPAQTYRLGTLKATIWKNEASEGKPFYSTDITRSYQKEGEWYETTSFGAADLPVVAKLAELATNFIVAQAQE